jgi:hypothetical protein
MRMRRLSFISVFGGIAGMLLALGSLGAALAQDDPQGDDTQVIEQLGENSDQASNPPGRAAQLSDAEGSVSLEPAGTGSWTSAALNRPLTLGDKLWADRNSRAELDIGDAVIRLGSTTGFSFLNLDEQTAQMQVTAGTVIVHVRSLAAGEQDEIDTPNLALSLQQPGTYRVEVSDSGDTTIVKVEDGEALATGGGQSYPITAQQSVTFTGTSTLAADFASLGAPDSLDDWSMQRDQQEQQQSAVAQQYVPPDTVGSDDLSSYGSWEETPDWGYAWFPAVAVGWVPYSVGYWAWISPWGWTWVDQEPWGFAPFHYGRWGYWHRRWCWVPGPRRTRPIYAPALVAWVGGPRAGAPASIGAHVGWFPLGPRDVYVPAYHGSARYVRNINIANARLVSPADIGNVYEGRVRNVRYGNSEVPGAVTAVPRNVFTSAQPVGPHRVILPHQTLADMRPTSAAPAIVPLRQSVLGMNAGRSVRPPPRALVDRPVVARLAPPRAPVSFTREQAAVRANGGRPLAMTELARIRPNTPAAPVRLAGPPRSGSVQMSPGMSARERVLQQPALPPARAVRGDRPQWAQGRPAQSGAAPSDGTRRETFAPQPRQAPIEWHVPQRQIAPEVRAPQQRFAAPPPPRPAPEQRFAAPPPPRPAPGQRFAPPPQPPERQAPEPHFSPPAREIPQRPFTPPSYNEPRAAEPRSAPREAPSRAPEGRPQGRPPLASLPRTDRRADAAPLSLVVGYTGREQPPPMCRPQESTNGYATARRVATPAATPFRPPVSPPPMSRPIPPGRTAAWPLPGSSGRLAFARGRRRG